MERLAKRNPNGKSDRNHYSCMHADSVKWNELIESALDAEISKDMKAEISEMFKAYASIELTRELPLKVDSLANGKHCLDMEQIYMLVKEYSKDFARHAVRGYTKHFVNKMLENESLLSSILWMKEHSDSGENDNGACKDAESGNGWINMVLEKTPAMEKVDAFITSKDDEIFAEVVAGLEILDADDSLDYEHIADLVEEFIRNYSKLTVKRFQDNPALMLNDCPFAKYMNKEKK